MHNTAVLPAERVHGIAARTFHDDPLTGFGDREKLFVDLTHALEPGRPPSVLAVFDLVGWSEHRRIFGQRASDSLTNRFAEAFALVMWPVGACYYIARDDEFCALISQPIDDVNSALIAAIGALNAVGESSLITAFFGATSLPDGAADPIDALMLADERLGLGLLNGKARERRQITRPI
jgi:GGDEF domain-containing protein